MESCTAGFRSLNLSLTSLTSEEEEAQKVEVTEVEGKTEYVQRVLKEGRKHKKRLGALEEMLKEKRGGDVMKLFNPEKYPLLEEVQEGLRNHQNFLLGG